ncbi:hypothetical protein UPYG_G00096530 [Umbra pygmaea]|uniref:Parvalbumin n=1 Tax=Umbra pygmaea TaxID=75934 RepID=A0ABD0X067_UMBPY
MAIVTISPSRCHQHFICSRGLMPHRLTAVPSLSLPFSLYRSIFSSPDSHSPGSLKTPRLRVRLPVSLPDCPASPLKLRHQLGYRLSQSYKMAMNSILNAADIKKALDAFAAEGSFDHKKFFEMVGLKGKSEEDVKKAFLVLDADASGFIEEEELKFVLKGFSSDGRDLTDKETKAFLNEADKDGDGMIGMDEFVALVHE